MQRGIRIRRGHHRDGCPGRDTGVGIFGPGGCWRIGIGNGSNILLVQNGKPGGFVLGVQRPHKPSLQLQLRDGLRLGLFVCGCLVAQSHVWFCHTIILSRSKFPSIRGRRAAPGGVVREYAIQEIPPSSRRKSGSLQSRTLTHCRDGAHKVCVDGTNH